MRTLLLICVFALISTVIGWGLPNLTEIEKSTWTDLSQLEKKLGHNLERGLELGLTLTQKLALAEVKKYNQQHRERSETEQKLRIVADLTETTHYLEYGEAVGHGAGDLIQRCQNETDTSPECKVIRKLSM